MIRRIELTNFMSHEHTVLEPAAGLTVLVGPNNCGKSAVVAALQILTNNVDSTYVMRHGAKECSVVVETDDGHRIEWHRKTSPSYVIDGERFDRLKKSGLPAELAPALRLQRVPETLDDIHFGEQKSPLFLIDKPAAHAARFFAASSDVSRLVEMQNRHRTKHNEAKKRKVELEAKSARLTRELDALAPLPELDAELDQQEAAFRELGELATALLDAQRLASELNAATQKLAEHTATTTALAPLAPPPEFSLTAPLVQWLETWGRESRASDVESARTTALHPLQPPPALADTQALASAIQRLATTNDTWREYQQRSAALAQLAAPPQLDDTNGLVALLDRLSALQQSERREAEALTALIPLAVPPELAAELPLQKLVAALQAAAQKLDEYESQRTALGEIPAPPSLSDPAPLAAWLARFDKQSAELTQQERELQKSLADSQATADQLRDWARQQQTCPTCGSQLDPDRLVTDLCSGGTHHG